MVASRARRRAGAPGPRVLVIVQNLHVPFDRRVWLECQTLVAAGYDVTVICPRGPQSVPHQVLDGVEIFTYRPYAPGGAALTFVAEYAYSLLATAWLLLRARRRGAFDALQACNPPEIFWPLALVLRSIDRTRFVFDHHDLSPELYESRFAGRGTLAHRGLLMLEKATFHAADRVISTNGSYAEVARRRGGKRAEDVTVVRTGPDADRLRRGPEVPERRSGRAHLVTYIGVMGPQDGVDLALAAADAIVHHLGRQDISFVFMGGGDCRDDLVADRDRLGLTDFVDLPGRVPDETVHEVFSTADVGLSPDPKNPLNDVSTMNKTMEYMAYGLPVVAFDLKETRVSAEDAAVYVEPNDVHAYAEAIVALLDDPERRVAMGRRGRERVETELAWSHQRGVYLDVYDRLLGRQSAGQPGA